MRPGIDIYQRHKWIFSTPAILQYVPHFPFNYPVSITFRFQKLNIPCLQLEITHTIERILQCYVAELEATKKVSTLHMHTRIYEYEEGRSESLLHGCPVPASSEHSSSSEGS